MIENLPAALSSLQTALSVGKAMLDINDTVKAQDKLIEFNGAIISAQQLIISAQQEQTTLLAEVEALKKKNSELVQWQDDKNIYNRTEVGHGVFAYTKKGYTGDLMNTHKYCCNCFDHAKYSTLQQFEVEVGRKIGLKCPNGCPDVVFQAYMDMY